MSFSPDDKHVIVNYHYVENSRADFAGIHPCSVDEFERQVKFLSENYKIISVPEVFEAAKDGSTERFCAITFDDGLRDQLQYAVPVLKKYGATATFFIITGALQGAVPAAHRIHVILSRATAEKLIDTFNNFFSGNLGLKEKYFIPKDRRITERRKYDDLLNANFKETLTIIPSDLRDAFLARVFRELNINESEINKILFMNQEDVAGLARAGFQVECHTRSHTSLENVTADFVSGDLEKANSILETVIGRKPSVLSYPHGRFSESVRGAITGAGFKYGVTIEPRRVEATDDPLLIPRWDTNDLRKYLDNTNQRI